jgi:LPXTG-motif cell wall-anchored protein
MGIVNRRNAVLGWGVWQLSKQAARRKAKSAASSSGGGRPNKSMVAVGLAGAAGALTFWRKRRSGDSTP